MLNPKIGPELFFFVLQPFYFLLPKPVFNVPGSCLLPRKGHLKYHIAPLVRYLISPKSPLALTSWMITALGLLLLLLWSFLLLEGFDGYDQLCFRLLGVSSHLPRREALKEQNAMWYQGTSLHREEQIPLSCRGTRLRYGSYKQTLG